MDIIEILKILIPVIMALCGTVYLTLRWALDKQAAAAKEYWAAVHEGLKERIDKQDEQYSELKAEQRQLESQVHGLDKSFGEFREKVAGEYIKREDWLEHAISLERKFELLRNDINKEIRDLIKEISKWRPKHGTD